MKLLKVKENANDTNTIDFNDLSDKLKKSLNFNSFEENLVYLSDKLNENRGITKEDFFNAFNDSKVTSLPKILNISLNPEIEKSVDIPGTIYYDNINDRIRCRFKDGWKTLKI